MNNQTSSGIGVASLLGIAFIVLRLCHVIAWPWLWVLAPFWIPFVLAVVVFLLIYIPFMFVVWLVNRK
jgi:hypothetical protein